MSINVHRLHKFDKYNAAGQTTTLVQLKTLPSQEAKKAAGYTAMITTFACINS